MQERIQTMPLIPMMQNEVKEYLKDCQEEDETKVINQLAENIEEKSVSCRIYKEWGLNRKMIRECQKRMANDNITIKW